MRKLILPILSLCKGLGVFLILGLLLFLPQCSSTGDDGGGSGETTYSNGGISVKASTVTNAGSKTTTITDDSGNTLVTVTVSTDGVTITFPGVSGSTDFTFPRSLAGLPSDFATQVLAVLIAGGIEQDGGMVRFDAPGCDWFPDTNCTLDCCSDHDRCYNDNNCGASSWIPFVGSDACDNCNSIASWCITFACAGATSSTTSDNCYDNRCDQFYDCPDGSCDCASPCDSIVPATCGNGSCDVLETPENCPGDCTVGHGKNQCCLDSNGCPTETGDACGDGCCCCGQGEVCGPSDLCAPDSGSLTFQTLGNDIPNNSPQLKMQTQ